MLCPQVDFLNWKSEDNVREVKILRRYLVQDRMDYVAYNKLCGRITSLVAQLAKLPPTDPFRQTVTTQLIDKLCVPCRCAARAHAILARHTCLIFAPPASQLQYGRDFAEEKSGRVGEARGVGVLSVRCDASRIVLCSTERRRQHNRGNRRRLPVVMVRLKMAETLREAVTFVEQGHVRVGPETVTDPAFLVTR